MPKVYPHNIPVEWPSSTLVMNKCIGTFAVDLPGCCSDAALQEIVT